MVWVLSVAGPVGLGLKQEKLADIAGYEEKGGARGKEVGTVEEMKRG